MGEIQTFLRLKVSWKASRIIININYHKLSQFKIGYLNL